MLILLKLGFDPVAKEVKQHSWDVASVVEVVALHC